MSAAVRTIWVGLALVGCLILSLVACQVREAGEQTITDPVPLPPKPKFPFFSAEVIPLSEKINHYGVRLTWYPAIPITITRKNLAVNAAGAPVKPAEELANVGSSGTYVDAAIEVGARYEYFIAPVKETEPPFEPSSIERLIRPDIQLTVDFLASQFGKDEVFHQFQGPRIYIPDNEQFSIAGGMIALNCDRLILGKNVTFTLSGVTDAKLESKIASAYPQFLENYQKQIGKEPGIQISASHAEGHLEIVSDYTRHPDLKKLFLAIGDDKKLTYSVTQKGKASEETFSTIHIGTKSFIFDEHGKLHDLLPYTGFYQQKDPNLKPEYYAILFDGFTVSLRAVPEKDAVVMMFGLPAMTMADISLTDVKKLPLDAPGQPTGLIRLRKVHDLTWQLRDKLLPLAHPVTFRITSSVALFDEAQVELLKLMIARSDLLAREMDLHYVYNIEVTNVRTATARPRIDRRLTKIFIETGMEGTAEENFTSLIDSIRENNLPEKAEKQ